MSILDEPNVNILAKEVKICLEKTQNQEWHPVKIFWRRFAGSSLHDFK